jgi:hypothetical protein
MVIGSSLWVREQALEDFLILEDGGGGLAHGFAGLLGELEHHVTGAFAQKPGLVDAVPP